MKENIFSELNCVKCGWKTSDNSKTYKAQHCPSCGYWINPHTKNLTNDEWFERIMDLFACVRKVNKNYDEECQRFGIYIDTPETKDEFVKRCKNLSKEQKQKWNELWYIWHKSLGLMFDYYHKHCENEQYPRVINFLDEYYSQ